MNTRRNEHESVSLFSGPRTVLHRCKHGVTYSRTVHLTGAVLLDTDRRVSVPVEFDGNEGFAAIENPYNDLLDRETVYKVRVIFDGQAYRHGANDAFQYTVVGSL